MERLDLVAVGDVMLDVAVEGEGHGASVRVRPGGSSANVAVWAASLGARAAVVGRVGDDLPGRMLRTALEEREVEARLAVDPHRPTGCVVTGAGGVAVDRGATAAMSAADLPELAATVVVVSGYALFQQGSAAAARAALERAGAEWLVVDGGTVTDGETLAAADRADALLLNEAAARSLTGLAAEEAAAGLGRRFRLACVTRGAAGAVASLDGELAAAEAPRVDAVDAVGAGDAFAAGFLLELARGRPLPAALEAGCRLGSRAAASPERWPEPQANRSTWM